MTASLKHGEKEPSENDTPRIAVWLDAETPALVSGAVGVAPSEEKSSELQKEPMNASDMASRSVPKDTARGFTG